MLLGTDADSYPAALSIPDARTCSVPHSAPSPTTVLPDLDHLSALLLSPEEASARMPHDHRATAVALVLQVDRGGPEVLLMRRTERADDHWSGQISLPGGHAEEGDANLVATVRRETAEEVGLDLARDAALLGALPPVQARAMGGLLDMTIAPFVFERLGGGEPQPGPEAVEVFWFPLGRARSGDLGHVHTIEVAGERRELPSWRFEGRIVWGLTRHILGEFLGTTGALLLPDASQDE